MRSANTKDLKIIKLLFAFFSISILLFGGNTLIGYSQPKQVPSSLNQQTQQQEDQQDLQTELQRLQRVQRESELGEEGEEEDIENATGPAENVSQVFSYDTDVPSIRDLRKIQIETLPGSALRAKVLGAIALGTPLGPAIGNLTSNGNLTSIANLTSIGNLTSIANLTSIGNLTTADENMTSTNNTLVAPNPPNTEPVSDRAGTWSGCDTGYLGRVNPQWVLVRPTPDSPTWTQPVVAEGNITHSRVTMSHHEFPFNHHSHDQNFHMALEPPYTNLKSTSPGNMEQEWEIGYRNTGITDRFPIEFWPWENDRVWMMGWWVIDCGHFKTIVTDPEEPAIIFDYKTEIHPPFITAFTRNEPHVFPGETSASPAVVTYIYLHGRGGNRDTNVGGQDYEFDIHMPQCTGPIDCTHIRLLRYDVKSVPFGGPTPILTSKLQENKAHVVIPLSNTPASPDLKYGAIVAAKWVNPAGHNSGTLSSRTLKVTFDSIRIDKDHDTFGAEWKNLWVGVNGKWIELSGPLGHYGLGGGVDDGDTYAFPPGGKTATVIVPDNGELKIKSTGWESDNDDCYLPWSPIHCQPVVLAAHDNDKIGYVENVYTCSENFGTLDPPHSPPEHYAASRPMSDGDDETDADYILSYHIEQISRTVGTVGGCAGPPPVTVPDVTCYDVNTAVTEIQEAGLVPSVFSSGPIIIQQQPQWPTVVALGSVVHLKAGNICP